MGVEISQAHIKRTAKQKCPFGTAFGQAAISTAAQSE